MTYAPQALLDLRSYLKPLTGLSDVELGIVGDANHNGGYHHGWDQRSGSGDYSWSESSRDSSHKTNAARAIDIGAFDRLREMSVWLVEQCAAGASDTQDIREIIYSPDGKIVKRWDRLGVRSSGDSSHLTHTHISFFADAEARDKIAVFRRFFEGGSSGGINMFCAYGNKSDAVEAMQLQLLQIDPNCLARFGADSDFGDETAFAVSCLLTGGDGHKYGPAEFAKLQQLVAQHAGGGKGEKGDPGPAGPEGPQGPPGEPGGAAVIAAGSQLQVVEVG